MSEMVIPVVLIAAAVVSIACVVALMMASLRQSRTNLVNIDAMVSNVLHLETRAV